MYFIVVRILGLFQNSNNSTDSSTTGTGLVKSEQAHPLGDGKKPLNEEQK